MLLFSLPAFTATPIGKLANAFKLATPLAKELLEELRDELEIEELLELLDIDELRELLEIDELRDELETDELELLEELEIEELLDELLELEIDELLELETEELLEELERDDDRELELKLEETELEPTVVEQTEPLTIGVSAAPVFVPKKPNITDCPGWIILFHDIGVAA
jgi:hypothetical protein